MERYIVEDITLMFIWLGFFTALFSAYFYYLRFRNSERMSLIEKEVDISEIYKKRERRFPWFMVGFLLLGIGLGLLTTFITSLIFVNSGMNMQVDEEILVLLGFAATIIFGALGVIIGHSFERKLRK